MWSCPSLGTVHPDEACRNVLKVVHKAIGNFQAMGSDAGWWNVYNIYDTCSDMPHMTRHRRLMASGSDVETSATWVCGSMRAVKTYFNRADVQVALHVPRMDDWSPNDDDINWDHPKGGISFLGEIKRLARKYPFLVFSGDVDAQIPHTTTETWTSSLGFEQVSPYQAWEVNKYVQGYVTRYEHNFTFATVKGAGHMVPLYRPIAAHALISRFVSQQWVLASDQTEIQDSVVII
eukprot:TRINITY_DN12687_c0_g1_i1.p1 TRINITY_DN12687_c0_g1~~TRINITY_DN12687_c0_g1_i1.p1  ORF type:complete len:234 (+),score=14.04 TRINITY_DN12687_c0_g1_i1:1-702(+)